MIGSLIGLGASALAQGIGSWQAYKANQAAKENIAQQKKENQNWFDRRYNEDATQRADAQRILEMTRQQYADRNKAAQGAAAVMGGTEESVAATKAANAQGMADAASQIAASGAARKDAVEQQYLANKQNIDNTLTGLEMQRAQEIGKATSAGVSALGTMGGAMDGTDAVKGWEEAWKKNHDKQ